MEGCLTEDSAGGLVAVSDGELPDEEDGELSELSEIRYFYNRPCCCAVWKLRKFTLFGKNFVKVKFLLNYQISDLAKFFFGKSKIRNFQCV